MPASLRLALHPNLQCLQRLKPGPAASSVLRCQRTPSPFPTWPCQFITRDCLCHHALSLQPLMGFAQGRAFPCCPLPCSGLSLSRAQGGGCQGGGRLTALSPPRRQGQPRHPVGREPAAAAAPQQACAHCLHAGCARQSHSPAEAAHQGCVPPAALLLHPRGQGTDKGANSAWADHWHRTQSWGVSGW